MNVSTENIRVIFRFFLCLLCSIQLFERVSGQNNEIDSLKALIQNYPANNIARIDLLNEIAYQYWSFNVDMLLSYAKEADSLSDRIDYKNGKTEGLNLIGFYHWLVSDYENALAKNLEALEIAQISGYAKGESDSYYYIGNIYREKGDFEKALEYLNKSIKIKKEINDVRGLADCYNSIGSVYRIQGDFPRALGFFHKSLELLEEIPAGTGISTTYNNIGSVYYLQKNYPKALDYYKKSLSISERTGYKVGIVTCYNNLGIIYFYQDQYEKSLDYFQKSLNIQEEISDKTGIAISYINIGEIFSKKEDFTRATDFYTKGLKLSLELGLKSIEGWSYWGLSNISFCQQNLNDSYNLSKKAFSIGKEIGEVELIKESAEIVSQSSAALGLYDEAYKHQVIFKTMSDSIVNDENTRKILGLEYEYKYQKEKAEQKIREVEQQSKLQKQRYLTFIFIGCFCIMVGLAFLIFRNYQNKKKDIEIISQQKNEIEKQKKRLEEQAVKLQELDEIKTRFFTNISHEFRTPLTLILGPTDRLMQSIADTHQKAMLKTISHNAHSLLDLINQLLYISKIEKGMMKIKFGKGDLKKEISFITQMFTSQVQQKKVSIEFICKEEIIQGFFDKEKIEWILYNLISNSIKNTEKGKISVSLEKSEYPGKVNISVSDTGKGIPEEKLPLIFDRFYMADESGIMGSGIGLSFTSELVKIYKGSINVASEEGKGTTFFVELPASPEFFSDHELEIADNFGNSPDTEIFKEETTIFENISNEKKRSKKHSETILLVEDHTELRCFISESLSEKFRILEAENGKTGMEMAVKHLPDLIITDVMMPEVDGMELTKTLKNNSVTSHIPIIILTAKASEESRIEGLETEADDYLTKPFSYRELGVRVNNLLKLRKKLREKYHRSIEVNPSEITTNSVDEQFLSRLLKVVESNLDDPVFTVITLCEQAGISRTVLHKKLKSLLGQSATEFINSIRVKRAAQLISQKSGSISEIAWKVGFNNLSYFSKIFKKQFKMTPSEMMDQNN